MAANVEGRMQHDELLEKVVWKRLMVWSQPVFVVPGSHLKAAGGLVVLTRLVTAQRKSLVRANQIGER